MTPSASPNPVAMAQMAANLCQSAIERHRQDAHLGLEYLLKRMTVAGLALDDIPGLKQLGIAVLKNSDINPAVNRIRGRDSVTPIAVAIANVVDAAPSDQRQVVFLGAVLGAHSAVDIGQGDHALAVFAVITAAATAQTAILTQAFIADGGGPDWAARD